MLILNKSLSTWNTTAFSQTLKAELEALAPASLPLHLGVSQGGMVGEDPITVTVLGSEEANGLVKVKVGVFFTEIVINCGCGDDPMPINAYCELMVSIDTPQAEATISVVSD